MAQSPALQSKTEFHNTAMNVVNRLHSVSAVGPVDGPSAIYNDVSPYPVLDFARERASSSFNVDEMGTLLSGGKTYKLAKAKTARQLSRIPLIRDIIERWADMSRSEKREATVKLIRSFYRMFLNDSGDIHLRNARIEMASLIAPDWVTRNGVHFGLFASAISSQASQEQADEWLPKAMSMNVYGCFAMTELRGGSYIKGLETTATYVPPDDESSEGYFDLHTPSIGATKWWIGGAGETATHATVYARLVTKGVDYGVHVFIVQLRDMDTHKPLDGVYVGDVGGKMGRDGIDNGYIQFHHYRAPSSSLLCKYAQVSRDGTYVRQPKAQPQLAYGALIQGRAHMVQDSASVLSVAATIAIRWAVARRQGAPFRKEKKEESTDGAAERPSPGSEPQIMDYTTHQNKLLPLVATAYAFTFTAHRMKEMYENLMNGMESDDVSLLPDVHATSAGLKAFTTWATHYGIDTCRQACGGHGYSAYSRLPQLFADFAVMCTWEGDNTVMALQTARYLISSLAKARGSYKKGKGYSMFPAPVALTGSVRYLVDRIPPKCGAAHAAALLGTNTLLTALRWRARNAVIQCSAALEAQKTRGLSEGEAWNATAVQLVAASRAHVYLNIAAFFAVAVARRGIFEQMAGIATTAGVQQAGAVIDPLTGKRVDETSFTRVTGSDVAGAKRPKQADPSPAAKMRSAATRRTPGVFKISDDEMVRTALYPALKRICDFFILYHIQGDMAAYLRYGYFTAEHANWIDTHVSTIMSELRKDALPLVDAFDIPDFILNTPMARADGDVYRAYMERVKKAPEATQSAAAAANSGGEIHAARAPYFDSLIRPLLEGEDLAGAGEDADVLTNALELDDAAWDAYSAKHGLTPTATGLAATRK